MFWLYSTTQFTDPLTYFHCGPQEPLDKMRSLQGQDFMGSPNTDSDIILDLWRNVYQLSPQTSQSAMLFINDIRRLEILPKTGFRLNETDMSWLRGMLNVTQSSDADASCVSSYKGLAFDRAERLILKIEQIRSRCLQHLAFRGVASPQEHSDRLLLDIAKVFNIRTVSIPMWPSRFWKVKHQQGDSLRNLETLLSGSISIYGTPPNQVVVNGSQRDLSLLSPRRFETTYVKSPTSAERIAIPVTPEQKALDGAESRVKFEEFYRTQFRLQKLPNTDLDTETVIYGMLTNRSRNKFLFPGTAEYAANLRVITNDDWTPPEREKAKAERKRPLCRFGAGVRNIFSRN